MNTAQHATLFAALRYWQRSLEHVRASGGDPAVWAAAISPEHFEDVAPLTCEQIDELCESLNGEVSQ